MVLPSTPLKATELRGDKWQQAMGIEQTEIDALATLNPNLLRSIVRDAMRPFYDFDLDRRVGEARREWVREAQAVLDDQIDHNQLERLSSEAQAKLETLRQAIDAINDLELPNPPRGPQARTEGYGKPLISSEWDYTDQTRRLIAHKAYEGRS
jgi:hypothetical protein